MTLVVRGMRVVTPDGTRPATLHVTEGRITAITDYDPSVEGAIDAGDAVISPGLVDTHVHINEPGRESWEGFSYATRAAAAGGVTTVIDMPLNSVPPTTTVQALQEKRDAARGQCFVDVGFLAGIIPGNSAEIESLHAAGVFGFKAFLCDSGVPEFPPVATEDLRVAAVELARLDALLMVHAEEPSALVARDPDASAARHESWARTRPVAAETSAIDRMARLSAALGVRVHVVHVSTPEGARIIWDARRAGARVSGETCPHYLAFAAEEVPDGATEYKCAPPLRPRELREGLWDALAQHWLSIVVTDHSPAPPDLRLRDVGDFFAAWGGISSLQLRLPAVWTEARKRGRASLDDLARWLSEAPARLVGLDAKKGSLEPGADADFILWHPDREFVVDGAMLRHRHQLTPWLGRRLAGVVEATYLRGQLAYSLDAPDPPAHGLLLERTHA